VLETERLILRHWRDTDRDDFAALNADPEVMADLGGPLSRRDSYAKLDQFAASFEANQVGRLVIEAKSGGFLGYAGVMAAAADHPLGPHFDIGWRLRRQAWGHGYATEAAARALKDAFERLGLPEVVTYTAPDNLRSQAVMNRLGLVRDASRDFIEQEPVLGRRQGLVWFARPGS
jgi:RimJ/RimL family protein N-acetyltransferase